MISQEQLSQIGRIAAEGTISQELVDQLRGQFEGVHFTYCMDDDVVGARPVFEHETFNLYLIDSRDHCLCFTQDQAIATGVVVAEVEPEDD